MFFANLREGFEPTAEETFVRTSEYVLSESKSRFSAKCPFPKICFSSSYLHQLLRYHPNPSGDFLCNNYIEDAGDVL